MRDEILEEDMIMSLRPLIAIFGTTGVGKSNLAIHIARYLKNSSKCNGARIINADAMQVYAGLDVLTNKVPEQEQRGIPHLLMGFKQPGEQYVVGQWVKDAISAIDETHRNKEIPIVVGGTSYWMQHLIFPERLSGPAHEELQPMSEAVLASLAALPPELRDLFDHFPPQPPDAAVDPDAAASLHRLLQNLDPTMAARWHWKDTRKVFRSLSIIKQTGRRPSDIVDEQAATALRPRYDTLCFWLYADSAVLLPRLDVRVDQMLSQGLLDEVRSLQGLKHANETDYTLGIYQSIGYREFHAYLASETQTSKAYTEAVENMKISTRQYARRQISWIRNKLLPAVRAADVPAYVLDATRVDENWNKNVCDPAVTLTEKFLDGIELPDPATLSELATTLFQGSDKPTNPNSVLASQRKVVCDSCTSDPTKPYLVDEDQLQRHIHGRTHRRLARKTTPAQHREANESKRAAQKGTHVERTEGRSDEDVADLFV
ncbi:tRNA dimethylallyltransferase [Mycena kentingensis (nom. inval.)]|nr:tRNA dimethylallyltransferase [Mycena kentingensis (nom. inval.)]